MLPVSGASGASRGRGELRNTFDLLSFSFSGAFIFFFSLSFIAFFMRESGAFFMGEKLLSWLFGSMRGAIYATLSRGARGSGAFGGVCISGAFLYSWSYGSSDSSAYWRALCDNRTD